ncbi:MAG: DUF402 domain-containing protein [Actinomycetes bacterium]|nr:MAG: DUF402 domain-containing protein [Actinomycetota bacterium]
MRPVVVQFLKYPDHLHWGFEALWLGEDEHGTWCYFPPGSRRWKGEVEWKPTVGDAVACAPHEGWWHLHYNGLASERETDLTHFVDITTQPRWVTPDRYEMVDLDLDVVVRLDGSVEIVDEDEFEEHQVTYGYTPDMVARAAAEARFVAIALEQHTEPFYEVAEAWLRRGRELSA